VRLLTGDEPKQAAAARRLFASQPIWDRENGIARNRLGAAKSVWIRAERDPRGIHQAAGSEEREGGG